LLNNKIKKKSVNPWTKNANLIINKDIKTIANLSAELQKATSKKSIIEGLNTKDARSMLLDIGLGSFNVGRFFKNDVEEYLEREDDKITFDNIVAALENIVSEQADAEPFLFNQLKFDIENAKSDKLKDPFKDKTSLEEHEVTARFFWKPDVVKVAELINLKSKTHIDSLWKKYSSTNKFFQSDNKRINSDTDIPKKTIELIKNILEWQVVDGVSPSLAYSFAVSNLEYLDLVKIKSSNLEKIIDKSKIDVLPLEKSTKNLRYIINNMQKIFADETFFHHVTLHLKLSKDSMKIFEKNKIHSFRDFENNQEKLANIIKLVKLDQITQDKFRAFNRLSTITTNFNLTKSLVEKNITSFYKISKFNYSQFLKEFETSASDPDEIKKVYEFAKEITAKSLSVASWAYLFSNGLNVDKILPERNQTYEFAVNLIKGGPDSN